MRVSELRHTGVLFFAGLFLAATANAANVGYYEMCDGQGDPNQATAITAAGHTPVDIVDISPTELSGVDVFFVNNCDNSSYGAEYLAALTDIEAAVSSGMVLMIHDRYVDPAETILPGGGIFDIIRDFTDDADINVLDDSTVLTNGPGGVIDDSTLDGGSFSSHGYAVEGSLPGDGLFLLSRGDPTEIVSFAYGSGSGGVYYSSIPLDFYLGGGSAFSTIYAPNVVEFGVSGGLSGNIGPSIPIPAIGVWGLLIMSLLMLAFGLAARRRFS